MNNLTYLYLCFHLKLIKYSYTSMYTKYKYTYMSTIYVYKYECIYKYEYI